MGTPAAQTKGRPLKVEVSFEFEVDREQAQAKADDARTGLKELVLDDGVTQD